MELWALRDGLILCHNLHLHVVDIQIDEQAVVDVVNNASYTNHIIMSIVDDCQTADFPASPSLDGHCYREANACADFLARKGALQASSFILYQDPPVDLLELISSDKLGLYCNRVIPALSVPHFFPFNAISSSPKKKQKCLFVFLL